MSAHTLVATMGFDERHILPALRLLPYDRLIVVAGRDTFRSMAFRRLRTVERGLLAVRVDPFDFTECLDAIQRCVDLARGDGSVRISATGGTKILTMAALLVAFHEGIEAWYCEGPPLRLPVLRGVRLADAFAPAEAAVVMRLRRAMASEALLVGLADLGFARRSVLAAIRSLERKGLLEVSLREGGASICPTPGLGLLRRHVARPGKA